VTVQHIFKKACALREEGRYLEALDAYTQAIEAGLEDPDAYHKRADTYAFLGLYREAIQDYDRAIELGVEDQELYMEDRKSTRLNSSHIQSN
jgi:tetratricopeptide (TPR) repeat protein